MKLNSLLPLSIHTTCNSLSLFSRFVPSRSSSSSLLMGLSVVVGLMAIACEGEGELAPYRNSASRKVENLDFETNCEVGEVARCSVTLDQANGVLSCYHGTHTCIAENVWGDCTDGTITEEVDPTSYDGGNSSGARESLWFRGDEVGQNTQALSTADVCENMPCDPRCRFFAENPPDISNPIVVTPGPSTPAGPLEDWSNPAVNIICTHQLCEVDTPALDRVCHSCVEQVCDLPGMAYCCDSSSATAWDRECVEAVFNECSVAPPPVIPPYCGFNALADRRVEVGNATRWPGSIGAKVEIYSNSDIYAEDAITYENINLVNNTHYQNVYTRKNITTGSGLSTGSLYAQGNITLSNNTTVNGDIYTLGNFEVSSHTSRAQDFLYVVGNAELKNQARYKGTSHILGNARIPSSATSFDGATYIGNNFTTLFSNSQIRNDGHIGGALNCASGTPITGNAFFAGTPSYGSCSAGASLTTNAVPPAFIEPTLPPFPTDKLTLPSVLALKRDTAFVCGVANSKPSVGAGVNGVPRNLYPGVYGAVDPKTIWQGDNTINFVGGGSYVVKSLQNTNSPSYFRLHGDGPWDITVCGQFHLKNRGVFTLADGTPVPPEKLTIYSAMTSNRCIKADSQTRINGTLIAPECEIYLGNGVIDPRVTMWAQDIHTDSGHDFGVSPDQCAANFDASGGLSCGAVNFYLNGTSYSAGDEVTAGGKRYVCRAGQSSNCSSLRTGASWGVYWPGQGSDWITAWEEFDDCPVPTYTGSIDISGQCPVEISPIEVLDYDVENCESPEHCQVNSRCTNVDTADQCLHSKCTVGGALVSAGCRLNDWCVNEICTEEPSCCSASGSWTADCVDRVATACHVECGETSPSSCPHNACELGVALDRSCDAAVADVCDNVESSCCDGSGDSWTQSCLEAFTESASGSPYSAGGGVNDSLCGFAVVNAHNALNAGSASIIGNVAANGVISGSGTVTGTARSTATISHSGVSAGDQTENLSDLPFTMPSFNSHVPDFNCPVSGPNGDSWSTTLGNSSYTNRNFRGKPTSINGGSTLYFNNLLLDTRWGRYVQLKDGGDINIYVNGSISTQGSTSNDNDFRLPADGSKVNIYICNGDFNLGSDFKFHSPSGNKTQLHVWLRNGRAILGANAEVDGVITMSNGTTSASLGNNSRVNGMIHTFNAGISMSNSATVDASGIDVGACVAEEIIDPDMTLGNPCPSDVSPPTSSSVVEGGVCESNIDTDDALIARAAGECTGVDLTLGDPCDYTFQVCNRGDAPLSEDQAEIVFYDKQYAQFATTSPDSSVMEMSRCPIADEIAAGTCIDVTCGTFSSDMTARVRLESGASDVECNPYDNWSYYPVSRACGGSGSDTTTTEEIGGSEVYEATCPENSTPAWGLLAWQTMVPGSSTITFSARTSFDGTFSGDSTELVEISSASANASCGFGTCALDVTELLFSSLTGEQPSHLELFYDLVPDGTNVATLQDWQLTYTCLIDQ